MAFCAAGSVLFPEPDLGDWERYDLDEDFWGLAWNAQTERLGHVVEAWYLFDPPDEIMEIIEHWVAGFWQPEEPECHRYRKAECYYRYPVDRPDHGRVYVWFECALEKEDGVSLSEAISDGLAHGLVLPGNPFDLIE
jgi:hypothetical protein